MGELPRDRAELFIGRILVPYHSEVLIYDGSVLVRFMMYNPVRLPPYTGPYNLHIIEAGYADQEGFQWVAENVDDAMRLARKCEIVKKESDIFTRTIALRPLNISIRDHLKNPFVRPWETLEIIATAEEYLSCPDEWNKVWSMHEGEGLAEAHGRWVIFTYINGALIVTMDGLRKLTGDRDYSIAMALRFIVKGVEPQTTLPNEEEKKVAMRILARRQPHLAMLLG